MTSPKFEHINTFEDLFSCDPCTSHAFEVLMACCVAEPYDAELVRDYLEHILAMSTHETLDAMPADALDLWVHTLEKHDATAESAAGRFSPRYMHMKRTTAD